MLFCPSFTQSERFLHTDQLITRLQVVVMTNFIRMLRDRERVQVRCSDLVGSDLPHLLIDVRQIAASVKVPGLCDEPLEESLQLEEIVFPLQSRLSSREMHISAESRKQRHRLNKQAAPLPNGKLGTTSEGFSTTQQVRIGETRM